MMNLQGYTINDKGHPLPMKVDSLANKLKRDFAIGFGATLVLAFFSDKSRIIDGAASVAFALTFIASIVRLVAFMKDAGRLKCPQCRGILEQYKQGDTSYIVCNDCRVVFMGYKPSTDPDKIFDAMERNDITKAMEGSR